METIFIANGDVQLAIVPKNEIEKMLLKKLVESGPVEFEISSKPLNILTKSVNDVLIIKPKEKLLNIEEFQEPEDL
jgi:hypothetical protein